MKKIFTAESYGELYSSEVGEAEYKHAVKDGVKVYRARTVKAGAVLDVNLCAVWKSKTEAGRAKQAKRAQNPDVIEKRNWRETERKIDGLLNENFGEGDYALYLTFSDADQDAAKALRWYWTAIRRERARLMLPELRYLYELETVSKDGEQLRRHVHAFLPGDMPREFYEDLWRSRFGIANATKLAPDENGLSGFAKYIQKAPRTVRRARRWGCSRNMRKPEEKRSTRVNGQTLTKKLVLDLVTQKRDIRALMESAYPGYRALRVEIRRSEYCAGVYIDVRMTKNRTDGGRRSLWRSVRTPGAAAKGSEVTIRDI